MIFRTALKYKIYEWCLDTLVGKLVNNLLTNGRNKHEIDKKDLRVGMIIDEIVCIRRDWVTHVYKRCRITQMIARTVTFTSELGKIGDEEWQVREGIYGTTWNLETSGGKPIINNGVYFYRYL